jgi:hypothetical protein
VHLHAPQTKTTLLALCVGELSSWKFASLLWDNIWIIGFTWLPKISTYLLAVIRPFRVITEPAEYQNIAAQIVTDPLLCFKLEPGIKDYRFPWAFPKHRPGLMLWTTWGTTQMIILRISNHQTSRFYDHHTIFFAF